MGCRRLAVACVLVLGAACSRGEETAATGNPGGGPVTTPGAEGRAPGSPAPAYRPSTVLGHIADPAIDESSGLAASRRSPGLLWTHNDSGDDPIVYCVDMTARTCGAWRVTGAEAFDWEDIAAGPGPKAGEPYLYVGDIGDNIDQRREIVVYRVPEPAVAAAGPAPTRASPGTTAPAEALRLRYPDGPHNAEALLVHPTTGDVYVVTKDGRVYKAAAPLDAGRVAALAEVGTLRLGTGVRALDQVTAGDISPDGRRVALSTYSQGYELDVPEGAAFDAVWAVEPVVVPLASRLQGEAIAYRLDGRALLTTSEVSPTPLQQVERR